ncbi:DNA repair protein rad16 [Lithohypha guttulata]|uniref:DNA repair protein rad16 n=1 Tax=Lithohypha guttulata TaxID=1690604 RepID=A0AAN7Y9C3_9EURO|nr:DNA repair protein rad16 [Lithohypha guttulata]
MVKLEPDMPTPDSPELETLTFEPPGIKATFQGIVVPSRTVVKNEINTNSAEVSDYETPETSEAATPAEIKLDYKATRISATDRVKELQRSKKRGRPSRPISISDSEDLDLHLDDAKFAAQIQAEEWDLSDEAPPTKRLKPGRRSMQELDESDTTESEYDFMPSKLKSRKHKGKAKAKAIQIDSDDNVPLLHHRSKPKALPSSAPPRTFLVDSDGSELSDPEDVSDFDDDVTSTIADTSDNSIEDVAVVPQSQSFRAGESWQERRARLYDEKRLKRAKRERTRLETQHPEIKTMWKDLENDPPITPVTAEQPIHINRKLKPFQLQGLDWMQKQEQTHYKGGLLGDEMGMGKTIQACSLIMSDFPAKQPTLVVVPPVALMQWQSEITDYTSGALNVLVYHISANPKCKLLSKKDLQKYNVIMISYSGLESIYRKENKGWARGSGIVKEDSIIHAIKYHRVILDEAHSIKQRTAGVAKACFALKANYKWCLSGTPVQNRIGEFFSLLRFLNVRPFACYFCKQCPCAELHWEQDQQKVCVKCKHSGFNHVSVFNQEILNPITGGADDEIRQAGFHKLRLITDRIMLRRLKRDHTSSMELPPKEVIIHNEFFGEVERDFSTSIMSNSARKFDTYVAQGVMLNNYANIFGLIMQMRQVADHPDLLLRRHAEGGQNILVCCICDEPAEEAIRSKCRHEFCRQCAKTYIQSFQDADADCPTCHIPLAIDWEQPDIEQDEENVKKNSIINRIKMENWTSSTKIEMLVYDLYKLRSKKQTHKSIVFSQFTSMLQLVQWRLQKSGFSTVLLDGSMTPAQRQKSIEHFMTNVDVEVFLVSLKAGGVALNLTEASRVFIIDPWWNPAAEWQSADRCHRIGQRRPCVITRLCIEDSVESRIVLLQEKKANLINGTINNDKVAMEKLTPEDMQFLFRGS